MSEYNSERKRQDQVDLEAITSSRFLQTSNQASDDNEDDEEKNKKRASNSKSRKPKTTSILKNPINPNRNLKGKSSPRMSRLQAYQNENEEENENEKNDDDEDEDEDDQNENGKDSEDDNDEHYPLSSHQQQQYNRTQQPQKVVKIVNRSEKPTNPNTSVMPFRSNQPQSASHPPNYPTALKNTHSSKNASGNSGYEMSKVGKVDLWGHLLIGMSYFFLIFTFPFSLCACVKVAQEYERAVIFRLGRILPGGAKGPGIFFVLPCIDTYTKVDLRTVTFDVPPQEILTKDSVTVSVDAVVYFRIFNAVISVINVEDAAKSTKLLAASTLRNILGTKSLHEILSDRESVAILIQNNLDDATGPWGVKVERVEVKDVRLPVQLQRAMATEAEAAREARAKVIAAEGEQKASKALKDAALVISESPIAIQLRYLQTLTQIASEKNSTIVFPIPLEMLSFLANKTAGVFKIKADDTKIKV